MLKALWPLYAFIGAVLAEMGLVAKWAGGASPVVYRRALIVYVLGLLVFAGSVTYGGIFGGKKKTRA